MNLAAEITSESCLANVPDAERFGGKAANLLELKAAGFSVPEFRISPACVATAVRELGSPLVVRSSAVNEDGEEVSFAGQFQTILDLHTSDEVRQAIDRCRQSLRAPSVLQYCCKHGIDNATLRMEVIIQRMIRPRLAGVAFTINPTTGRDEVLIEACHGLADDLLAGRCPSLPPNNALLAQHRPQIEAVARQVQRHFGTPQDIEFAIDKESLYILQARPITRIEFSGETGQWTNADFRDGGVSSSVCSPLMSSLYQLVWDQTLKQSMRTLKLFRRDFCASRIFFGRPYWNLGAVKECLAELPGFVERKFDEDLSVQINYEGNGTTTPVSPRRVLRAFPAVVAAGQFLKRQQAAAESLLSESSESRWNRYELDSCNADSKFRELIDTDYLEVESTYFRTIFAASLAKMDFMSSFPEVDYAPLVSALPPLRHMAPVRAVRSLSSRTENDISRVVVAHRHHYRQGLDVIFPRWDEDHTFVTSMLEGLPPSGGKDPSPAFESIRAETRASLPRWKRRRFDRKLARLRNFLWLREELRDVSNQAYYLIRQLALAIAEQRELGDDIFFQTFSQIVANDVSQVDRNREIHESYRHFRAPHEIGSRYRLDVSLPDDVIRGIPASPGKATGVAFIATDVEQATRMPSGHILVCRFIDPGWTPVLDRVGGVVTETGGLLSHAAIICREYGIPAVLAVDDATNRIQHGARIEINGNAGLVEPFANTEKD